MTDPTKVQGFLDLAGAWQPTLAFVMGGGLLITVPAFAVIRRRQAPLFAPKFVLSTRRDIDARLLMGAACFGIGWGLAGFCPGPAIASLATGNLKVIGFCLTMLAGMALADRFKP